ncbi:glycosyltransferase [Methylolobus aquaticus]|nr:glycosyltransferase [Methylolobus aquaticus]
MKHRSLDDKKLAAMDTGRSDETNVLPNSNGEVPPELEQIVANLAAQLADLRRSNAARDSHIASLNRALLERDEQIADLTQALTERDANLAELFASTSWRLTAPVRLLKLGLPEVRRRTGKWVRSQFAAPSTQTSAKAAMKTRALALFHSLIRTVATGRVWSESVQPLPHTPSLAGESSRFSGPISEPEAVSAAINEVESTQVIDPSDSGRRTLSPAASGAGPLAFRAPVDSPHPRSPEVTVIVPNFNHAPFLERRLDSIYRQTYRNFTVILLDDCSSDNSRTILQDFARRHHEITQLHANAVNSGNVFAQWKKGLTLARGDLIWIAESDDFCDEDFLARLVPFFSDEAVQLAYCRNIFVNAEGEPLPFSFETYLAEIDENRWSHSYVQTAHREVSESLGIKNSIPNVSSVVFRKPSHLPLLEEHDWASMKLCGDWIFYLNLIRGGKVAFTSETNSYYRFHTQNSSVSTHTSDIYYREHERVAIEVAKLYNIPGDVLNRHREIIEGFWQTNCPEGTPVFEQLYRSEKPACATRLRKPNILMVGFSLCAGGGEIFPVRLAAALKERGYAVTFFDFHGAEPNPLVRKMLPPEIPLVDRSRLSCSLDELIDDFGIEIIHSHHTFVDHFLAENIQRRHPNLRHVVTMHGLYETDDPEYIDAKLPTIMRSVDEWIYIAEKNLQPFIERGVYQAEQFTKIGNGIKPPKIAPVSRDFLGVPIGSFVLCLASRGTAEKGWREAIMMVKEARTLVDRDIHLVVLGDGVVYDELKSETLPHYVHLLGFVENPIRYFAASDLGFLPSRFKGESFPLSVIECLMAGAPVLASDIGEIRDMLTHSQGGLAGGLISLSDWTLPIHEGASMIARFASDSQFYNEARQMVPKVAARFDLEKVVDQYEAVYARVLSGNL